MICQQVGWFAQYTATFYLAMMNYVGKELISWDMAAKLFDQDPYDDDSAIQVFK